MTSRNFYSSPCMKTMFNWESLAERTRADIEACLDSWLSVLKVCLGSRMKYAYAKGSAVKQWNSPIDYVPIISDVDIHIMLNDSEGFFQTSADIFEDAMTLSQKYEDKFRELRPDHLHIPRSQLNLIDKLIGVVQYVPPRIQDIKMLFGDFILHECPLPDRIRQIDLENLLSISDFIAKIPDRVADRTGLDFWTIIREMTWRVSPSPIRLLTQKADAPMEVWSWNRTRIVDELNSQGYSEIAQHYRGFYMAGWNLFLSNFESSTDFRSTISSGYYLLKLCLKEAQLLF